MADVTYLNRGKQTGGAPALPAGQSSAVHCLMIPLSNDILLLPNAAIAEVAAYQQLDAIADAPDWYLGKYSWRDYQVPVIAFELLTGNDDVNITVGKNSRIAILNTLNGNMNLPYIGIMVQGIPRLQVVQSKAIEENASSSNRKSAYVADFVLMNGEPVTIPNIDMIERAIMDLTL